MLEFGGLWKHENNQHALVPPKTECNVAAQEAGELKTVTYATPSNVGTQKERKKEKKKSQKGTGGKIKTAL